MPFHIGRSNEIERKDFFGSLLLAFSSLNSICKYQDCIFYEVIIIITIIIIIIIIIFSLA